MNRRRFLVTGVRLGQLLAGAGLGAAVWTSCGKRHMHQIESGGIGADSLTLKQMAARKLHHGPDSFINPFSEIGHGDFLRVLKWKLFAANEFRQYYPEEQVRPVSIDWDRIRSHAGLSVTFIKHACVMIGDRGRFVLVDPVFGGIFSFIKDFSPLAFSLEDMPAPEAVLITHGHYDHLDIPTVTSLGSGPGLVTPLGYRRILGGLRNRHDELDWFETWTGGGFSATLVPCNHWTMRNPLVGPNRSLWGSYILKTDAGPVIFLSGDVAWFDRYREIGAAWDIDLAVFNLGAYEPRWFMKSSHMNPDEVARAFRDLGAKRLMIVHWGAFRLGDEPVHFPPRDIRAAMAREGMEDRLVHADPGQTLFFGSGGDISVA